MIDGLKEFEEMPVPVRKEESRTSRLTDATVVRQIYQDLVRDDQGSANSRVRVQAMKDGAPPYNQAALNASGQGSRANANFLMGADLINRVNNGYLDIITSVKSLMTLEVENGEPSERLQKSRIICEELTRTIRKWPKWMPNFLRAVDLFTTHGVGFAYFPDGKDFRFEVTGFEELLIPRQTAACEDEIPYAVARKDLSITKLALPITDPETATKLGWNVVAVKSALEHCATTTSSKGEIGEFEKLQKEIKNHDIYTDRKYAHVPVLYSWVQEYDGKVSFFIAAKDAPGKDFLYSDIGRYDSIEEALIGFCYGIGNGTYHSIRGLGYMIYPLVQLHNRLMNQKADGSMMDESIMVQAESNDALQEATMNYLGPFSMISPGFSIVDKQVRSGSERTMPFLGKVEGQAGQMASRFSAPSSGNPGVYQNELNSEVDLESSAVGESGPIDLFYSSFDRLMRQVSRRILQGPATDKLIAEFLRRVKKAGITDEDLKAVDIDSIYAMRALGAGSPAARAIGFRRLMTILPQLDEVGRREAIYQYVSNVVGYQNALAFATPPDTPRPGPEAGLAETETILLLQGHAIPVIPGQMDATHLQIHLPKFVEFLEQVERGEADPLQNLQGLQAGLDHIAQHGESIARDPTQEPLYKATKEAVNNLQQVVSNMERKLRSEERKARESGEEGAAPGAPDVSAELEQVRLATAQLKLSILQREGELKLAGTQAKMDQELALGDMKAAAALQKEMQFPRSSISSRR